MAIQKSEAIVLNTRNFRETSLIVNFFTQDFGKISGLIKGVRNEPQRYGGLPLVFSRSHIVFYAKAKRDLSLVTQCDPEEQFPVIRADLTRTHYAHYLMELLDSVTQSYDKNEQLFGLTVDALRALAQEHNFRQIARIFEIRLLNLSGFKPRLDACVNCQKKIIGLGKFSALLGGILCAQCFNFDRKAQAVLKGTLASLEFIEQSAWPRALKLQTSPKIAGELETILTSFITVHLDKEIKSRKFLI